MLHSMWDPSSPIRDGTLITGPPGKSPKALFLFCLFVCLFFIFLFFKALFFKQKGIEGISPSPVTFQRNWAQHCSVWGSKLHKKHSLERRAGVWSLSEPVLGGLRAARKLGQRHWLFRTVPKAWCKGLFVHCSDFYMVLRLHPQEPWTASPA